MTKRRHHYTREDLALSLTQSLDGNGPDYYSVQPAERVRFAVQILRRTGKPLNLIASIPFGSAPERRRLLDDGWDRVSVGRTRYYRRVFADAASATAAMIEAYRIVYGAVGDDRGWTIVTPALRPRTAWPEPWTGEEEPIEDDHGDLSPASATASGRGHLSSIRARRATAVFGVAVGIICTWAALQSFTASAGWTIGPVASTVVLIGCAVLSTTVAMSGLPDAVVQRSAYMWGSSLMVRAMVTFAFAAVPAIVWALGVIRLLGTPPGSGPR